MKKNKIVIENYDGSRGYISISGTPFLLGQSITHKKNRYLVDFNQLFFGKKAYRIIEEDKKLSLALAEETSDEKIIQSLIKKSRKELKELDELLDELKNDPDFLKLNEDLEDKLNKDLEF